MIEPLFNYASPTNLHVVTSTMSTYMQLPLNSDKFNLCSCMRNSSFTADRPNALVHTCPKKYTPWLLTVSCCNVSAIMLINPLNTVTILTQSSTIIRSFVVIVRLGRRIRILVVSASYRRLHKNSFKYDCSFPLDLSRTRLDFWFMCVAAFIVASWSN